MKTTVRIEGYGESPLVWTKRNIPKPLSEISRAERILVLDNFRYQCKLWIECWQEVPDVDTRNFLWNLARIYAHIVHRNKGRRKDD